MDGAPVFLGVVRVEAPDVRALNVLREPRELVIAVSAEPEAAIAIDVDLTESGREHFLFGTAELFSAERDDCIPMDFGPTSTRTAQRELMAMLRRDPRNACLQVTAPVVPTSVAPRGHASETMPLSDIVKCFDLSELVRDCHYPIQGQPAADPPRRLADHGLVLRDYQKSSLQWLLDKERNDTGMGSAGELWSRRRGFRADDEAPYFYCELTGSFVKDIFDYCSDVQQKDAARLGGDSFPSSAILGYVTQLVLIV